MALPLRRVPFLLSLWVAAVPPLASAASRKDDDNGRFAVDTRSSPLAIEQAEGLSVQIVLRPTARDIVGARNLHHTLDDIRVQVTAGAHRGPRLKAFLRDSNVDQLRALPLPSVWVGTKTRTATTTAGPAVRTLLRSRASAAAPEEVPLSTPWPNIPAKLSGGVPIVPTGTGSAEDADRVSMRDLLGTEVTTTAAPAKKKPAAGVMVIAPDAYTPLHITSRQLVIERGPNGIPRECGGDLCKEVMGDSGTVLYPKGG